MQNLWKSTFSMMTNWNVHAHILCSEISGDWPNVSNSFHILWAYPCPKMSVLTFLLFGQKFTRLLNQMYFPNVLFRFIQFPWHLDLLGEPNVFSQFAVQICLVFLTFGSARWTKCIFPICYSDLFSFLDIWICSRNQMYFPNLLFRFV